MRLLALDASTRWGGAALLELREGEPRLVAEIGLHVQDSHTARLLPMVERLLASAEWTKDSLDAYAAVRGPGAFTGVRVGLGLISGLAMATGRPSVGVGTLPAMAEAFGAASVDRVPLLDAGRGEVYGARFDPAGSPPVAIRAAWVGPVIHALEPGVALHLFGGGAETHAAALRAAGYSGPIGRAPTTVAAGAGRIALRRLAAGLADPADMAPLYVRPPDAELKAR